jgi:SAM-dependent methyltransferase
MIGMAEWRARALRVPVIAARTLLAAGHRLLRFTRDRADLDTAAALTTWAYDRAATYKQAAHQQVGWFDFEAEVLRAWFPPPPARILVAGCGAGRELIALQQAGFHGVGGDPAARLIDAARARLGPEVPLAVVSLQQLDRARELDGPFDAAIVGWGAWGHVLERRQRENALIALHKRCPAGPVLLSWAVQATAGLRGGAQTVGDVLAGTDAQSVGRDAWRTQVHVNAAGAFQARLGALDIEREAAVAGYRVVHIAGMESGYPHAVLQPI